MNTERVVQLLKNLGMYDSLEIIKREIPEDLHPIIEEKFEQHAKTAILVMEDKIAVEDLEFLETHIKSEEYKKFGRIHKQFAKEFLPLLLNRMMNDMEQTMSDRIDFS